MWSKIAADQDEIGKEWELVNDIKSLIENGWQEDFNWPGDRLDLIRALTFLHNYVPELRLDLDLCLFQLFRKLLLVVNGLTKTSNHCQICLKTYDIRLQGSVKCSDCCVSSHFECTSHVIFLPGMYWRCADCDQTERNEQLHSILTHFKQLKSPELVTTELLEDEIKQELCDFEPCSPTKGYLCDLCPFSTFSQAEFESHVQSEEAKFAAVLESISSRGNDKQCSKCDQSLASSQDLFDHVVKFHSRPSDFPHFKDTEWKVVMSRGGKRPRSCAYCGLTFDQPGQWIAHLKAGLQDLKCVECEPVQFFDTFDAFKIHLSAFHKKNGKRFLCAFCDFAGDSAKELNQHVNLEHEGNFNQCTQCDFQTWAHSVLRRHINVKHRKIKTGSKNAKINPEESRSGSFKCCFCDFVTTSKKSFGDHFDLEHEGNRSQCLQCDFKAPVISHLRRHIESVHKGLKRFQCDHCQLQTTTKQGLDRHVRVKHLNLNDLKCPHCEFKTSAPDALRSHAKICPSNQTSQKRIYFGNRTPIPMVCRLCHEAAPTTNKLAAHFAECHPFEKPFWCHQCNIGYETYYGIQNHNRKDHSEERHLCPICGYSTHGPQYLKRHFRRKHPAAAMLDALASTTNVGGDSKNLSADEKMRVALELKGLSDEQVSEKVKALIELSKDGVWTCGKCARRFEGKPKRALYSHIRERHFHMRHYKCKECNFLSYNRAEIQEHKEKHKADKPIHQCDLCGFICDNSTGLIRHKRGRFCQNGHLQRRKRDRDK